MEQINDEGEEANSMEFLLPMPREDADTPDIKKQCLPESGELEDAYQKNGAEESLNSHNQNASSSDPELDKQHISRDFLTQTSNQLIDSLNVKRKKDAESLSEFKADIERMKMKTVSRIEGKMCNLYEIQGKVIQDKIHELFECLNRIAKLEEELDQFKGSLQIFYQDMQK